MSSTNQIDYKRIDNAVKDYIYMSDYPDWGGLAQALRKLKLNETETQKILMSVRKGGW